MNKSIAVYHWWSFKGEDTAYCNLRSPIVTSIATLRAVSDVEIFVLDGSDHEVNWGNFPDLLNFKVLKNKFTFFEEKDKFEGWRHLSRIPDIHSWSEINFTNKNIIYVDSDVFFLQNPLPLACDTDKFCWDGWNTGYFYFNSNSKLYQSFYKKFISYCYSAIFSNNIRSLIKNYSNYDDWYEVWDEMILLFMKNEHPEIFNIIPIEENSTCRVIKSTKEPKVFHANGLMVKSPITDEKHCRGLLGLIITEFYEKIESVLSSKEINLMYGSHIDYYKNNKFSILEKSQTIEKLKNKDGHFYIEDLNKNITALHLF
jgi:hypothetical protein